MIASPVVEPTEQLRASVVILSHSRTGNLPSIVNAITAQPFVDDVVIWHQGAEPRPVQRDETYRVFCRENLFRYGRFAAMDACYHNAVLVCDDDILPKRLDRVWAAWQVDPTRIATMLHRGHYSTDAGRRWGTCHEVLLGWGAIVDRRWRDVFDLYIERFGVDKVLLRKADRIFSILQQRTHNTIEGIPGRDFDELPGCSDELAEWKQPDHGEMFREARRRCLNDILGLNVPEDRYQRI